VAFTSFFFKNSVLEVDYSRGMVIYAWLLTILLVLAGRVVYGLVAGWMRARGIGRERLLIVGAGDVGQQMVRRARSSPQLGYEVVGFVDDTPGRQRVQGVPILGRTNQLGTIIDQYDISEVIIALPEANHSELLDIIDSCQRGRVTIKVFPSVFQIMASEVRIGDLNGLPLLTIRDTALRGWKLTLKRAVDVVVAATVLVLFSPLMLLIALLIKLDSPGPVFYIQERMGLDARPFPMIKFRTMRADAEAETGPVWATPDDPRRTRLGAFLRRTSLDELPQFINVLLGQMSVVGPRPERPVFVEQFRRQIPRYMYRHREKAGITGWAQVNGLRGDTSIEERTKYDLWYTENWSLWLDFKIMLKTLVQIFRDPNAY
jgi:Undecaprenyl-phosphate glucose phosphotransferase